MAGWRPASEVASGCPEWDCAGIPHPPEVAVAAAGTAVVRVAVAAVVAFVVVVVMDFVSSSTATRNGTFSCIILPIYSIIRISPVARDKTVVAVVVAVD